MKRCRRHDLLMDFTPDGRIRYRSVLGGFEGIGPPEAALILSFCGEPRTREEVVARFGAGGGGAYDALSSGGLLVEPGQAAGTPLFFETFASLDLHRRMLADRARVDGYAAAIAAAVQPGMVVMDAGTGTGVLACMAAAAGAARVYAVDAADLRLARTVVEASGFSDRITLVSGDLAEVILPEPVDLLITETFGALAFAEGSAADLAAAARRNLRPGGVLLPGQVSLFLAPLVAALPESPEVFGRCHGADLRPLAPLARRRGMVATVPPEALGAPGEHLLTAHLTETGDLSGRVVFPQLTGERLYGFVGWFSLHLGAGHHLSTAPDAPRTHWQQQVLPVEPGPVPDVPLEVSVAIRPAMGDRRGLEVAATWAGQRWIWRVV